ncbi:hypothetical protein M8C21_015078, partial [Ambrosia artemisiifolia]
SATQTGCFKRQHRKQRIFGELDLAFDLSLSALLGDNIYNFGELLAHPIVSISHFLLI